MFTESEIISGSKTSSPYEDDYKKIKENLIAVQRNENRNLIQKQISRKKIVQSEQNFLIELLKNSKFKQTKGLEFCNDEYWIRLCKERAKKLNDMLNYSSDTEEPISQELVRIQNDLVESDKPLKVKILPPLMHIFNEKRSKKKSFPNSKDTFPKLKNKYSIQNGNEKNEEPVCYFKKNNFSYLSKKMKTMINEAKHDENSLTSIKRKSVSFTSTNEFAKGTQKLTQFKDQHYSKIADYERKLSKFSLS